MTGKTWRRVPGEVLVIVVPALVVLFSDGGSSYSLVSALSACAVLPLRHWWPRLVLLLCLPAFVGGLGWAPGVVALFAFGRARPHFRWQVGGVLLVLVAAVTPVLVQQSLTLPAIVLTVSFVVFAAGAPVALGALVTTRHQLTESLRQLREATAAELEAKEETARAEERARIAREIHDAVGHHVTLIAVESAALAATSGEPETQESAGRLRGLAKQALDEMRTTLGLSGAGQPNSVSLRAIPELVARARQAGLSVELYDEIGGSLEFAAGVERAAYRVVQEALTNVSKHAPGADVTVRLEERAGRLRVSVVNGAGRGDAVDVGSGGSGLAGLSERVQMAGGELEVQSAAGGGFELVAVLPQGPR
ncbi:sensor histidine kinase [Saccharopolyspora taberi]|uniref:sensor histidine kinase n=1 Tax=Saccharopolyspora taberi TaxID=60895 RepID=UPI0031D8ED53